MNCFSHAFRFLDKSPYFVVGTCLPDWLTLIDRKVRVRQKRAEEFLEASDQDHAWLAAGIVRHHRDDHWFHANQTFVELNLELSIELRDLLGKDAGFRPHLASHILIEVLLDRFLSYRDQASLERFYRIVGEVDPRVVETRVNCMATRPTTKLEWFIPRFLSERYLFDYLTDKGIQYRLNRVLNRVKLPPLPDAFLLWIPSVWRRVQQQQALLLDGFSSTD